MSSVLVGPGSYIFWGYEATVGGGIQGKHLPFNKIEEINLPAFGYVMKQVHTASDLSHQVECTEKLEIPEMEITSLFHSPFVLLAATQYNTVTNTWTGTGDAITGGFTANTHKTSMWVQVRLNNEDGSNLINLTFKGGFITEYAIIAEVGEPLKESFKIKFSTAVVATQHPDIDDGLDDGAFDDTGIDGGWCDWDGNITDIVLSSNCTITWNSAALPGIHWKKVTMPILLPRRYEYTGSSLEPQVFLDDKRPQPVIEVEGITKGNQDVAQILTAYESKNKYTFKIQYMTTAYFQYTNVYVQKSTGFTIPKSEGTLTMPVGAGYAFTYSWTANEATDPSDYINHADP